jgi:hypothetical protein
MHVAFHENQSGAENLDQEFPDRQGFLEIIRVVGEYGFQGLGRGGDEAALVEEAAEADEAVVGNVLYPIKHFLAGRFGELRCAVTVEEVVALCRVLVGVWGKGREAHSGPRNVSERAEEEGPDEDSVEECEDEVVDEESDYGS